MKKDNPFSSLTIQELILWLGSIAAAALSFILSGSDNYLTLTASLIGATALIFVSKGYVIGQVLTVVFSVFYGIISFVFSYYGEMINYLGMTSPIAVLAVISWTKNPYKDTKEVTVSRLSRKQIIVLSILTVAVTIAFYFILGAIGTANLVFSTISVATSFAASSLTFLRSPYYAAAYSLNDIILIILWSLASTEDKSYFPMIICFSVFLLNDLYGFYNWQRIKKKQQS